MARLYFTHALAIVIVPQLLRISGRCECLNDDGESVSGFGSVGLDVLVSYEPGHVIQAWSRNSRLRIVRTNLTVDSESTLNVVSSRVSPDQIRHLCAELRALIFLRDTVLRAVARPVL